MRLSHIVAVCVALAGCGTVVAANDVTLSDGLPADVQMSPKALRSGVAVFERAVERGDLVGAVLLVARDGKIVLHEAVGFRDVARTQPLDKNAQFRMGSNTKAVVAAGTLILADRGKIGLDDPIYAHLPAFDTPRSRAIRVRHLLNHTSGITLHDIFVSPPLTTNGTLQSEVNRLAELGAEHEPGTRYYYVNPTYNILGAMIEVASGQELEQFLRSEIFQPLGMEDTTNQFAQHGRPVDPDRLVPPARRTEGKWVQSKSLTDSYEPGRYRFVRGSGGVISTATDFARFCQMTMNGGIYDGKRILSESAARAWIRPQEDAPALPGRSRTTHRYGFGWRVAPDGSISHTGSGGTFAWIDFDRRIIGVVLTANMDGVNPRAHFRRLVESACLDHPTTRPAR